MNTKEARLVKILDCITEAELFIDELETEEAVEEQGLYYDNDNDFYIELGAILAYLKSQVENRINYPSIEELTLGQIVLAINHELSCAKDIDGAKVLKDVLSWVERGELQKNRDIIEWVIKKRHVNSLRKKARYFNKGNTLSRCF